MIFPSEEIFAELSRQGNLIPIYKEIISDIETPVSAFLKLDRGASNAFLLESVERGERFGRYSFVGANPSLIFEMRGPTLKITRNGKTETTQTTRDPLQELQALMSHYRPISFGQLPIFYGGAIGFLSYEAARFFEPKVGLAAKDDLGLPDAYFVVTDSLLIFDHLERRIKVLANVFVEGDPSAAYQAAVKKIDAMIEQLRSPVEAGILTPNRDLETPEFEPNMTKETYIGMTEAMQEYIRAGDIFQVVPSQRFSVPFDGDPIELYRALRFINPSPYMFCLKLDGFALVGSSPETHVRCENGKVEIRPIAGTRPRRVKPQEDEAMAEELLADPKERAEHLMLVDLARNDVGRVCEFDSVRVTDFMSVERYSHVMHIVSHVEGTLRPGLSAYDVMRATFPAGTVTGSPKVRAMQIIAEQEPTRRGCYAGAVGYFGFSGNLDSCITIRTVLLKDGLAHAQAGGGLVADSTALGEYNESVNKAKASMKAIALAKTFA
jgi:anthranilate synthase component 1